MAISSEQTKQPLDLLLLSLPAELRNQIYSYLLPYPLPDLIIRARYVRFRWIVTSRRLFNDVAPQLYKYTSFTTYLKLDPTDSRHGTLAGDFCDHLRLTYGEHGPHWVSEDACKLIRNVSVDVAASDFVKILGTTGFPFDGWDNMLSEFKDYFADVSSTLPNIEKIRICFQDQLTDQQSCPSVQLRSQLLEIVDVLKQTLPVEVLHYATRNYNALSPLVLLPFGAPGPTRQIG